MITFKDIDNSISNSKENMIALEMGIWKNIPSDTPNQLLTRSMELNEYLYFTFKDFCLTNTVILAGRS